MAIKIFSNIIWPLYLVVFLAIIFMARHAYAKDYYGILQVTYPNIGLTQLVIQKCDREDFCKILNKDYWRGLRTTCPHCTKDYEVVTASLPPSYKGIYQNKPIVFPYLSSKKDRIIFYGVPMEEAIGYCRLMLNEMKTKLNRPAIAVMPLGY